MSAPLRSRRAATGTGSITAVSVALLAAAVAVAARNATDAGPDYRVVELRDNVHAILGAGSNTLVFRTVAEPERLVVIDPKFGRHAKGLREAIRAIAPAPIDYLCATHHHEETAGGLAGLRALSTTVILHDDVDRRLRDVHGRAGAADLHFRSRLTLELGGSESLTLHHKGPGHTDGDTVAHFAKARILVVGGIASRATHPSFAAADGANLRRWIRTLDDLVHDFGDDEGLLVVPADGEPGTIDLLRDQASYLRDVLDWMENAQRHGQSRAEALTEAQPLREKYANWRGSERFEALLEAAYVTAGGGR